MFGLAADREGAVVVGQTGGVQNPAGCNAGNPQASARKYDADGNLLWTMGFGTPAPDNVNAVALKGNAVYLAGVTRGALPGQVNSGVQDAFVMRIRGEDIEENVDDDEENDRDDDDYDDRTPRPRAPTSRPRGRQRRASIGS